MPAEPRLSSNNPFRKKGAVDKVPLISTTSTTFDDLFPTDPARPAKEEAVEAPVKRKVVKRVRVQSPPPSSPDDTRPNTPAIEEDGRFGGYVESSDSSDAKDDPFENADTDGEQDEDASTLLNRPPPNPFTKTLQDLEQGAKSPEQPKAAPGPAKGSLDVVSFRQLLLTGRAGPSDAPQQAAPPPHANANLSPPRDESSTDASSISRQSFLEPPHDHSITGSSPDSPRSSHEIEYDGAQLGRSESVTPVPQKKKPPPPSSRHGKLIKIELGGKTKNRTSPTGMSSPSDVNKPLPPAPIRKPTDEDTESIFDRESLGKVPEPNAPVVGPPATPLSKKPMPAPPPRRKRTEDKGNATPATSAAPTPHEDYPRRSSNESMRSKSDSTRYSHFAPAPPPPRRPNTGGRLTSSFASPSTQSFGSTSPSPSVSASDAERSPLGFQPASALSLDSGTLHIANVKLAPPPPPPARNVSTRRPQSSSSIESLNRRPSMSSKEPAPPPPPRRQRGSSRGSIESVDAHGHGPRRSSEEGPRIMAGIPVVEEPLKEVDESNTEDQVSVSVDVQRQPTPVIVPGHGQDILADLDALQQEVNALQQRYAKAGDGAS